MALYDFLNTAGIMCILAALAFLALDHLNLVVVFCFLGAALSGFVILHHTLKDNQ